MFRRENQWLHFQQVLKNLILKAHHIWPYTSTDSTAMWSYPISLFGRSNTAFGWKIIKRPVEAPVVSWADHPKRKAAEILLLNDGKLMIFPCCQANGFICFFISAPALFCYFYELTNKIKHIGKYFIVLITSNWPP